MKLVWNAPGSRFFETGVDQGVLYTQSGLAVPWNGLISIEQSVSGGEFEAYYMDGVKYFDSVSREDFKATLTAFSAPKEFAPCEGNRKLAPGLIAKYQTRERFGLSWRTKLGNDLNGVDQGYRLHLVYNLTASPATRSYQTLSDSPTPMTLQWELNAVPLLPGSELINQGWDPGPGSNNTDPDNWVWLDLYGSSLGWPSGPDGNTPVPGWQPTPYIYIDENKVVNPDALHNIHQQLPHQLPNPIDISDILTGVTPSPHIYVPPPKDPDPGVDPGDVVPDPVPVDTSLPILITEVYKGALEDYPNDSIIPYGPANLSDASDLTGILLSSMWAADWFIYFDTTKIDVQKPELTLNFRIIATEPSQVNVKFFDGVDTFASTSQQLSNPPNSSKAYELGWFNFDIPVGTSDYTITIDQSFVDLSPQFWTPSDVDIRTIAELVTAIKSKRYAILRFRRDGATSNESINVVSASVNQQEVTEYPYFFDVPAVAVAQAQDPPSVQSIIVGGTTALKTPDETSYVVIPNPNLGGDSYQSGQIAAGFDNTMRVPPNPTKVVVVGKVKADRVDGRPFLYVGNNDTWSDRMYFSSTDYAEAIAPPRKLPSALTRESFIDGSFKYPGLNRTAPYPAIVVSLGNDGPLVPRNVTIDYLALRFYYDEQPLVPSDNSYQDIVTYSRSDSGSDTLQKPPFTNGTPGTKRWLTLGSPTAENPRSYWDAADGIRIRFSSQNVGQKVEVFCEMDSESDYLSFYQLVTIQGSSETGYDNFVYLDEQSFDFGSHGATWSVQSMLDRLSYMPPNFSMESRCSVTISPWWENTEDVTIGLFVAEAWRYKS
jgi:hypothetical protein